MGGEKIRVIQKTRFPIKVINFNNIKIEKVLIGGFAICFTILIIAQLLMLNRDIRVFLTQEKKVEGVILIGSGAVYSKGVIVLELDDLDGAENVWILVNGKKVANFRNKQATISVKDDDLIEIDATQITEKVRVKVVSYSNNVKFLINNNYLECEKNIKVLARVKVY